jgi:hypothetical protein
VLGIASSEVAIERSPDRRKRKSALTDSHRVSGIREPSDQQRTCEVASSDPPISQRREDRAKRICGCRFPDREIEEP